MYRWLRDRREDLKKLPPLAFRRRFFTRTNCSTHTPLEIDLSLASVQSGSILELRKTTTSACGTNQEPAIEIWYTANAAAKKAGEDEVNYRRQFQIYITVTPYSGAKEREFDLPTARQNRQSAFADLCRTERADRLVRSKRRRALKAAQPAEILATSATVP